MCPQPDSPGLQKTSDRVRLVVVEQRRQSRACGTQVLHQVESQETSVSVFPCLAVCLVAYLSVSLFSYLLVCVSLCDKQRTVFKPFLKCELFRNKFYE